MRRNATLGAWLLCGTLDIAYAAAASVLRGGSIPDMLRGVASGPFVRSSYFAETLYRGI